MICCVVVLRLLAWIAGRLGLTGVAEAVSPESPSTNRKFVAVLLAGAEIALVLGWLHTAAAADAMAHPDHGSAHPSSPLWAWFAAHWWSVAAAFGVATVFWTCVMRYRMPDLVRFTIIGLVLEVGALLALAMLLGADAMESTGMPESPLPDQGMAGVVMMVVDTVVVASMLSVRGWARPLQVGGSAR